MEKNLFNGKKNLIVFTEKFEKDRLYSFDLSDFFITDRFDRLIRFNWLIRLNWLISLIGLILDWIDWLEQIE